MDKEFLFIQIIDFQQHRYVDKEFQFIQIIDFQHFLFLHQI